MKKKIIIPEVVDGEPIPADLLALRNLALLLDEAVQIPGTRKRIGLDAALGLIPGVGDYVAAIFSSFIVVGAVRHRVPPLKILRMLWNICLDLLVGLVPVAGDLFDLVFKQNVGNVDLLVKHRNRSKPPRRWSSILMIAVVVLSGAALISLGLLIAALFAIISMRDGV